MPTNGLRVTAAQPPIPAGSFLVYYFQAKENIRCDPEGNYLNGKNEAGVLFASLDDAQSYAASVASGSTSVGAGIYDSSWQVTGSFLPQAVIQAQAKATSPGRLSAWAMAMLAAGCFSLWVEIRSGWRLYAGFLIGVRLLLGGIIKLYGAAYRLRNGRVLQ